jgi:hypothetical protein
VVSKTREPVSTLENNQFYDLVPVDQVINKERFTLISFGPVFAMWILGGAWGWVRTGFRGSNSPS